MLMLWTLFAIFVTGNQFLIKGICSNMALTTNLRVKIPPILIRDIPKIIKFKATNSLRVSCLFCIFKHSPQKTV